MGASHDLPKGDGDPRFICTRAGLSDDLGWQDLGFRGDTDLREASPFIDGLAAEGVRLNQLYVSPVCSPTRAQFLTGMYALRLGFPTVVNVNRRGTLSTELPTVAEELRGVGYRTAMVGKVCAHASCMHYARTMTCHAATLCVVGCWLLIGAAYSLLALAVAYRCKHRCLASEPAWL